MTLTSFKMYMFYNDTKNKPPGISKVRWNGMLKHWAKFGQGYIDNDRIPRVV